MFKKTKKKKIKDFLNIKNIAVLITLAMFFVLDRYLKFLSLRLEEDLVLVRNFLSFSFYPNENISFSIPVGGPFLVVLILILILFIFYYCFFLFREGQRFEFFAWLAILFGAISNFIDRIKFYYVIDYIDVAYFTIFNLADVLIVSGCAFIIFLNFFNKRKIFN